MPSLRILFVCSGAEQGRDGVGDYTTRLALELSRHGQSTALLAINDRHLESESSATKDHLRLSIKMPWEKRIQTARDFVCNFRPDVLSLQFVGYGFNSQGLPLGLASRLEKLAKPRRWHVMLHELWIEPSGGWRFRALSQLQKILITRLFRELQPGAVHTSNSYYQQKLQASGISCEILPLFGNIPVVSMDSKRDPAEWVFVFFGSLRRGWEPEPLLSRIEHARSASGKSRCRFISIGRLGEYGETLWARMENAGYKNFVFQKRGELPVDDISRELRSADFGIAISPLHLLGKSGAVAAMREHGLPVVVNRICEGISARIPEALPSVILLNDRFAENLALAKKSPCHEGLPDVAEAFLRSLAFVEK